ncbi:alpha-ketoglutarate-dependent dioxygenase AlkB family protein [Flavobacterium lacisediminis]|uniref:Alpha-ketoglutarate-dependent dioxygenase AlkB n=1 Tax=Flavobacterium lacisediminis TaxID=2989705 RepID=A0ABT3EGU8_9FLAO|nr:alpha-ketoglutarate-dependent dioxygenase AlkB [Flavobacterium lacisediminis]MCW1147801.1 alpha-ketoglutarate-dependent dioxygenase AlkB [Flavobacterium lacisediminis]
MLDLFPKEKIIIPLPDAVFEFYPNFFNQEEADMLFEKLMDETPWQQDDITIFGKKVAQPRLTCLFGNEGKPYSYSGLTMQPHAWNPTMMFIKEKVDKISEQNFTTVLANLYRNEKDSNGWHADNEKELGRNPIIASVSFGEERKFQLKHNTISGAKMNLNLNHGSLLLMKEGSQIHYKHQIPKATQSKKSRINLTFRTIL